MLLPNCQDALGTEATDDYEMPRRVKRAKVRATGALGNKCHQDAAIDRIWPDIEQDPNSERHPDPEEIMWDLALRLVLNPNQTWPGSGSIRN